MSTTVTDFRSKQNYRDVFKHSRSLSSIIAHKSVLFDNNIRNEKQNFNVNKEHMAPTVLKNSFVYMSRHLVA